MKYGRAVHAKATRNVVATAVRTRSRPGGATYRYGTPQWAPWFYYTILRVGFRPLTSRISPPHLGLFWGPVSQNRRRTSGWELESQIRRAPGRGETPRPLVWVQLGTAPAPSVFSLRSTIEVLSPASLEAARCPLSTPPLIIHRHPSVSL